MQVNGKVCTMDIAHVTWIVLKKNHQDLPHSPFDHMGNQVVNELGFTMANVLEQHPANDFLVLRVFGTISDQFQITSPLGVFE